ncbi:hypothetical protein Ptr902_00993 [Pyrenophora tritici-repentis]|nr:hypothetical protein Ptr902_00993 [Pyrenophora tritici-repentis]
MPIKPGDLVSNPPGPKPNMVWDGRRMRVLWEKRHGNGDPSNNLIPHTKITVRGHPTWKLYDGDVPIPIIRGKNEPPHYVYLDDRACYTTYASNAYTTKELQTYWPFDFDRFGNIVIKRPNRGRPAYTDDPCTAYATGPMRGTIEKYEFCGASELLREYNVVPRSKEKKERPKAPESRFSDQISLSGTIPDLSKLLSTPGLTTPKAPPALVMSKAIRKPAPLPKATLPTNVRPIFPPPLKRESGSPTSNTRVKLEDDTPMQYVTNPFEGTPKPLDKPARAVRTSPHFNIPTSNTRIKCEDSATTPYITRPLPSISEPLNLSTRTIQTSPHSNIPSAPATFRKRPLHGSLANFYPKRAVNDAFPVEPRVARRGFFAESFAVDVAEAKRVRVKEEDSDT